MTITEAPTTVQSDLTTRAQALINSPHWEKVQDPAKSVIEELLDSGKLYGSTDNLIGIAERVVRNEEAWHETTALVHRQALSLMTNDYWRLIKPHYEHHMVCKAANNTINPSNIEQIKECISRVAKMLEKHERDARSQKPTSPVNFHVKGTPPKTKKKKVPKAHSTSGPARGKSDEIPFNPNAGKKRK